jgi:hypothetical protein
MRTNTFDGKCKSCEKQMEEVNEKCPRNENGIYITYHCSYCGTYAYYYDNDAEPTQWITPSIIQERDALRKQIEEKDKALNGFLEIQKWCKEINVKSYGSYQTALNERMEIAKKAVTEKISHAAIVRSDGILEIAKCHPEIIGRCPYGTCKAGSKQGFVTSLGRYVDRKEALQIAIDADQINKDMDTIRQSGLISENIWADTDHKYDTEKGYYIPDPIRRELAYVLGQIINDLPKNKDWLDPALEKSAVAILKDVEKWI